MWFFNSSLGICFVRSLKVEKTVEHTLVTPVFTIFASYKWKMKYKAKYIKNMKKVIFFFISFSKNLFSRKGESYWLMNTNNDMEVWNKLFLGYLKTFWIYSVLRSGSVGPRCGSVEPKISAFCPWFPVFSSWSSKNI